MQRIVTNLWFDTQAEEAAQFYISIFKNSRIVNLTRYAEGTMGVPGSVMTCTFELDGQQFTGINGGPQFKFTEAISLLINCEDQAEIDYYWNALSAGGEEGPCGWLKDKYGLSWQVVPTFWDEIIAKPGAETDPKVVAMMQALLQMGKIDIQALQDAYNQG